MNLHVVLVEPLIPQNTGNLGRLTAANKLQLHLIEPLGFELTDKYLKRSGLDYWPEVQLSVHQSWNHFLTETQFTPDKGHFFSTKGEKCFYDVRYAEGDFLIFGNETSGFPEFFYRDYEEYLVTIPIENTAIRSLNLANAASVAVYEAKRQLRFTNL